SFILRGDAAMGMELTFASLMARAEDEPDALYGLAARALQISSDGLTYRFLMRPGITFHDGSPLTAGARRVGSSTRDGRHSRTSVCARPSSMHSISNGPTRTSCTGPMKGRIPCTRIPT